MPYTTPRGITVPGAGDPVNALAQFRTLADTTDTALAALKVEIAADTGWSTGAVYASGFQGVSGGLSYRRVGALVTVKGFVQWTGGSLTGRTFATLPNTVAPASNIMLPAMVWSNRTTIAGASIDSTGALSFSTYGYILGEPAGGAPTFPVYGVWMTT